MKLILMDHLVPAKLSEIQRALDPLDIEGLSSLVTGKSAVKYPNESLPLLDAPEILAGEDPTLDEWRRFMNARSHHKPKDERFGGF